jgi:hypothetical protein
MNNNQSQDILAKLLATENVTVIRKNVATASFDIKNRVLTLPRWKKLTTEIEEMLILHEVGHALYTSEDGYGIVYTTKRHLRGYANIIEDVRIEKKMKDRYPGSRKTFNSGYTQLNERDFFGVKDRDLSELLLIDRINLYYKAGYACGVTFTAEEYPFVQRADKCVTEEDVLELAEDVYNYSKQKKLVEDEEEQEVQKRRVKRGDFEEGDDPYDDYEMSEDGDESEDESEPDVNVEPETIDNFEKSLDKHQDRDSRTYYFDAAFETTGPSPIVPYATVIQELSNNYTEEYLPVIKQRANTFKTESNNIVNYLVKEFEMRKSASAYKRTKISKLGQLDTRKLFAYKLKEDLFKQVATVQEGKKHGMIFLLDWSGSMMNYMEETVEQVVNLAMFCQKINIPYQVFAFSDGYSRDIDSSYNKVANPNGIDNVNMFSLLELFSNKMNTRDFNRMIEFVLDKPWYKRNKYALNGTPLNHALLYMVEYVGKFVHVNNVEKMNLIVLTDGESNTLHHYDYNGQNSAGIKSGPSYTYEDGVPVKVNATSILRDTVTRKEYEITDSANQQTSTILQLLKDRYGLRTTGFYVTGTNARMIERFLKYNCDESMSNSTRYQQSVEIQAKLKSEKAAVLKNVPARDEMYIIATTNKIVDEDLDSVKSDMSASQISKQLTKMFTSRKTSRVVLNSFIGVVA